MSLTSELARPDSPISRFFAQELPDVAALAAGYGHWAGQLRRPLRPRFQGQIAWPTLGHTIDHRIRVSLGHPYGPPIEIGVAAFARPGQSGPPAVRAAIHQVGQDLLKELTERTSPRPPLVMPGSAGERLIRLCYLASHYEAVYRSGAVDGLLAEATADSTLESMVVAVPPYAVADIGAQLELAAHEEALAWLTDLQVACGPVFAGSAHVGGADADFVVSGELIDCKATVKPANLGVRELYQLAGYLLLDYDDQHQVRVLSLYLSRQGALIGWSVEEFLATLGATKTLPELRQALARTLAAAAGKPRRP